MYMLRRIGAILGAGLVLLVVFQLYISGSPLLAAVSGGGLALTWLVYTSRRSYAYRYLFPGAAALALFVVLPLIYTMWIGFTNYSSSNLLSFDRATEVLLDETYQRDTVRYQFALHADHEYFRLLLDTGEDDEPDPSAAAAGAAGPGSDARPVAPAPGAAA